MLSWHAPGVLPFSGAAIVRQRGFKATREPEPGTHDGSRNFGVVAEAIRNPNFPQVGWIMHGYIAVEEAAHRGGSSTP